MTVSLQTVMNTAKKTLWIIFSRHVTGLEQKLWRYYHMKMWLPSGFIISKRGNCYILPLLNSID